MAQSVAVKADKASPKSPTTMGPYTIEELLGHGAMGMTYLATHNKQKRRVALRVLPPIEHHDRRTISRFVKELSAASDIRHPNIVRATDAGQEDGTHYIAMEIVDGVSLTTLLESDGRLSSAAACEVVRQTAAGLQTLHENGLLHRDVKPGNIMLTRNGVVRLLDVGVASLRPDNSIEQLAVSGMLEDTPDYVAPEMIEGSDKIDVRADIYSLGCTLYHLLTGKRPFDSPEYATPMAKLDAHRSQKPTPIRQHIPDISPELAAVVHRMIAKDPDKRYRKPSEVVGAMCAFANGEQLPKLVQQQLNPTRNSAGEKKAQTVSQQVEEQSKRKSKSWFGLGALFLIGLLGGLTALALNHFGLVSKLTGTETEPTSATQKISTAEAGQPAPSLQSDRYHSGLTDELKTQFGLTNGEWVITPTELGNASRAVSYGNKVTQIVSENKPFANVFQFVVPRASEQPWDAAYFIPEVTSIKPGDSVLMVFWMRTGYPQVGDVSVFVEDSSNFVKEIYQKIEPTQTWQQFLIPFEAGKAESRSVGFHLASQKQLLEFGGFSLVNYGKTVPVSNLPTNLQKRSARQLKQKRLAPKRTGQRRVAN